MSNDGATESVGLRERKKAEARSSIIRAALRLFHERGFANVTVEQIADAASVSRRSFFRYFPTKEDVVLDRRQVQLRAFRRALLEAPEGHTPAEVVRAAFASVAADYRKNRARILAERPLFLASRELRVRDLEIDRELELAIVDLVCARSEPSAEAKRAASFFAAAAMGIVRVVIDEWAASNGAADIVALGAPALDTIVELLPEQPGPR